MHVGTHEIRPHHGWRSEEIGWALVWLLGIPLPIIFAIYVISPH